MKGTIVEFIKLVESTPELARELGELAARYDFEFTGQELSDDELGTVSGGGGWADTLSDISKSMHDASMAIINNMR